MSETVVVKKKEKTDFGEIRKLEVEYKEAVEDCERKEEILIKKVHAEYLEAENKGEFFEQLKYSYRWYYNKFEEYDLKVVQENKSESMKEAHQERKKQQLLDDLDKMKEEVESRPFVEVDETLAEESNYVDPREEDLDWIESTKAVIADTESKDIVKKSNFGTYQQTRSKIEKMRSIYKTEFNVSEEYRKILIHQLKQSIEYLQKLLEEIL